MPESFPRLSRGKCNVFERYNPEKCALPPAELPFVAPEEELTAGLGEQQDVRKVPITTWRIEVVQGSVVDEKIERAVNAFETRQIVNVERDRYLGLICFTLRFGNRSAGEVNGSDRKTVLRQVNRVISRTATKVDRPARCNALALDEVYELGSGADYPRRSSVSVPEIVHEPHRMTRPVEPNTNGAPLSPDSLVMYFWIPGGVHEQQCPVQVDRFRCGIIVQTQHRSAALTLDHLNGYPGNVDSHSELRLFRRLNRVFASQEVEISPERCLVDCIQIQLAVATGVAR